MAHIHTEAGQYDNTVSAFIVHREKRAILLHRHIKLQLLVQPGGHIELHETPWQTMEHELLEETGYELNQLSVGSFRKPLLGLEEVNHPLPLVLRSHEFPGTKEKHYHTDSAFAFLTNEAPKHAPAEGESTEFYWLNAKELSEIPAADIIHDTRVISLYILNELSQLHWEKADSYEV